MLRKLSLAGAVVALSVAATGCVVSGSVRTRAYVEPSMVAIEPGVYVVADYDEPVFYTDGYYWLYRGGGWYRSGVYTGGWVHVRNVPGRVHRIRAPRGYVHYRARGNVHVYRAPARRGQPVRRVEVRDHRKRVEERDHRTDRDNRRHRR